MTVKNKGLGRGFDVLMPTGLDKALLEDAGERVQNLSISSIEPNPDQPRRIFDDEALRQLAESIKRYGVLQPLIVSPNGDKYIIIAGERRWRASKLAGLEKVPAIARTSKELEQLEIALVENIQRVDLSPMEQAVSIARLHDLFAMSFDDIAKRLGKAPSTVNNIVRLLQLPEEAQEALRKEKISEGHARSVLALKDYPEAQKELLKQIQKHGWSVRQAEQFVVATKSNSGNTEKAEKRTVNETPETKKLSSMLKRPVTITNTAKGGKLQIGYKSQEDLEQLLDQLKKL